MWLVLHPMLILIQLCKHTIHYLKRSITLCMDCSRDDEIVTVSLALVPGGLSNCSLCLLSEERLHPTMAMVDLSLVGTDYQ